MKANEVGFNVHEYMSTEFYVLYYNGASYMPHYISKFLGISEKDYIDILLKHNAFISQSHNYIFKSIIDAETARDELNVLLKLIR